jgi:hypothetical protein
VLEHSHLSVWLSTTVAPRLQMKHVALTRRPPIAQTLGPDETPTVHPPTLVLPAIDVWIGARSEAASLNWMGVAGVAVLLTVTWHHLLRILAKAPPLALTG